MKLTNCILLITLLGLFVSCGNDKEVNKSNYFDSIFHVLGASNSGFNPPPLNVKREYVYAEFDLCEPDPSLYPILDAVVAFSNECPELKTKDLLYSFWIHQDEDSLTRVDVEVDKQKRRYCLSIARIFLYKGLIFAATSSEKFKNLFINTGLKVKYLCLKKNSLICDVYDGQVASWDYIFINRKATSIGYSYCNQNWRDERYYKSEKAD